MKKGRYEPTYAIWYLLCKDTNANHNLKHHYLKLKLPFLNKCKSDLRLRHFVKASEGLVSPCPEPFFCSWFHRHLILKKPWAYVGLVKRVSSPSPLTIQRRSSKRGKCTTFSVHAPEHHLWLPHPWDHTAPWLPQDPWKTAGGQRWFWGFTALHGLQGYLQLSHEAHTLPFVFPAAVTQEWKSQILETLV